MDKNLPDAIRALAQELKELPGIGPRQAIRMAFYISTLGANRVKNISRAVDDLGKIKICERCFFPTSAESEPRPHEGVGVVPNNQILCDICKNKNRRQDLIMIVEKETDLISLENAGKFNGRYLVLGPIPKAGMLEEAQKLRLQSLKSFIEKSPATSESGGKAPPSPKASAIDKPSADKPAGKAEEIILAFNPSTVGDFHASLVAKELEGCAKKISRLGRGLPTGGEIEFADDETLGSALDRRG